MEYTKLTKVLWSELFPFEFIRRLAACPFVYLPMGLCEPHGQISAFGLDTIKAEWLCQEAARIQGGIVAPSQGYHIHETGYHARWLEEVVGEENPHMTGMPPDVVLRFFLYQLRAFVNAGFKGIVVISGHSGGNQEDLRKAAQLFMEEVPVTIFVASDPELVEGQFVGDHAGRYEISQLQYLRPELINFPLKLLEHEAHSGGVLALGEDSFEATSEWGEQIMQACLKALCEVISSLKDKTNSSHSLPKVSYETVEKIWDKLCQNSSNWVTAVPGAGQKSVSEQSQWKCNEYFKK